jgi:hypothetical protein
VERTRQDAAWGARTRLTAPRGKASNSPDYRTAALDHCLRQAVPVHPWQWPDESSRTAPNFIEVSRPAPVRGGQREVAEAGEDATEGSR